MVHETPGWRRIAFDPRIRDWAEAALPLALKALDDDPAPRRSGGTWAVGLDLLPNAPDGRIGDTAFPWAAFPLTPEPLHRAQLSTVFPGYPRPDPDESAASFRFRQTRAAAHLDELLAIGPDRRRMVKEPHGWILGLPLTDCSTDAAPLTVWEGSAQILRAALVAALAGHQPETWHDIDVTEAYAAARAQVFQTCRRVDLPARPGEAILLHRLTLHGVAPWGEGATAPPEGRITAYFRPQLPSVADWLGLP